MKCIILAGGAGDRLWPLSRKNYPKQFINIKEDSSLFQETITRNIPFCDEFLIVTNLAYKSIVESQMKQFQGLQYRVVYEERGLGTAPAILTVLEMVEAQEEVLIIPADLYISGIGYSDAIYQGKEMAKNGAVVLFGVRPSAPETSYGYIRCEGNEVKRFVEKPSKEYAQKVFADNDTYWNCGMILCQNQSLRNLMDRFMPSTNYVHGRLSIEKAVLEKCDCLMVVPLYCEWNDVSSLEAFELVQEKSNCWNTIEHHCVDTVVMNETEDQLVVANGLDNVIIVNTDDAIYVSNRFCADEIKKIISSESKHYNSFFQENDTKYRQWGYRKTISQEKGYRTRKVVIYPGCEMSMHSHEMRTESYSVVKGMLSLELDGRISRYSIGEGVVVTPGKMHRLFNESDENLIIIEVDTGAEIDERDMHFGRDEKEEESIPSLYRLHPAYKDYLWGGNRLVEQFHKDSPYDITAESWELSAHTAGQSEIMDGPMNGMAFGDFINRYGRTVCGWKSATFDKFPILIKFIDAAGPLSVQIHPYDDYAFIHEKEFGKNEMWYVMDAEPDAFLYCGFNRKVTKEEVECRIAENTITEVLNQVSVKKGDCVFIPAGTIHAIGKGILICEIQQSSNSTYRVYDYDRRDANGNARELHVEKALDVMNFEQYHQGAYGLEEPQRVQTSDGDLVTQQLCQCKYFRSEKYSLDGTTQIYMDDSSFVSLVFLEGIAEVFCGDEKTSVKAGDSLFVASGRKVVRVEGQCEFIKTNI